MKKTTVALLSLLLSFGLTVGGCGQAGDDDDAINEMDGGVLFGESCVSASCHSADGSDLNAPTAADIGNALANQPAMAQLAGMFSDDELGEISSFLVTGKHSSAWRREHNHGRFAEERGVGTCEVCHGGPDLTGDGAAVSCFSCHGNEWD